MIQKVLFIAFLLLGVICDQIGEVRITGSDKIHIYKAEPFVYGFFIAAAVMLILILINIEKQIKKNSRAPGETKGGEKP